MPTARGDTRLIFHCEENTYKNFFILLFHFHANTAKLCIIICSACSIKNRKLVYVLYTDTFSSQFICLSRCFFLVFNLSISIWVKICLSYQFLVVALYFPVINFRSIYIGNGKIIIRILRKKEKNHINNSKKGSLFFCIIYTYIYFPQRWQSPRTIEPVFSHLIECEMKNKRFFVVVALSACVVF